MECGNSLLRLENATMRSEIEQFKNETKNQNIIIYGLNEEHEE